MLVQQTHTELSPAEVIQRAREFFTTRFTPYGGFLREASDSHIVFSFDSGELMLGTSASEEGTLVRGSTSRLHHELSQFLATLGVPEDVQQNAIGPVTSGAG